MQIQELENRIRSDNSVTKIFGLKKGKKRKEKKTNLIFFSSHSQNVM